MSTTVYNIPMEVRHTLAFDKWVGRLKDREARKAVFRRLDRLELGHLGDFKAWGRIIELRIDYGAGYRLYCTKRGRSLIILLVGGDKSTQAADIAKAQKMEKEVE
ncbi:addiction module antitoxin RelB [Alphaproteobacteria bacterium]|nr:addiction module antitoxin RelB [Alphaproteobacteria bacterium]